MSLTPGYLSNTPPVNEAMYIYLLRVANTCSDDNFLYKNSKRNDLTTSENVRGPNFYQ